MIEEIVRAFGDVNSINYCSSVHRRRAIRLFGAVMAIDPNDPNLPYVRSDRSS